MPKQCDTVEALASELIEAGYGVSVPALSDWRDEEPEGVDTQLVEVEP